MELDNKARRSKHRVAEGAGPIGEASNPASEPADDTQGNTFLPDRSGQYLAQARERDIRQHLSRRELENEAKKQKRK
jgi:hypothetical protein